MIPWIEDGAHEGAMAAEALAAIFRGSTGPVVTVTLLPAERVASLLEQQAPRGAWPEHDGSTTAYSRVAWGCAAAVLDAYRADPRSAALSAPDLWRAVLLDAPWLTAGPSAPSSFQWGWGVNCARRLCELPPTPNPALAPPGSDLVALVPGAGCYGALAPGGRVLVFGMADVQVRAGR